MCSAIGLRHPASASCLGRHLRLAGRCPNNSSLFPPLAAVVVVALCTYSAERIFIISQFWKICGFSRIAFSREGSWRKMAFAAPLSTKARRCRGRTLSGSLRSPAPPKGGAFGVLALSVTCGDSSPKGRAKCNAGRFLIAPNTLALNLTAWLSLRESWRGSA